MPGVTRGISLESLVAQVFANITQIHSRYTPGYIGLGFILSSMAVFGC